MCLEKKLSWSRYRSERHIRYNHADKYEIIRTEEESQLPAKQTLRKLDVLVSTFYG